MNKPIVTFERPLLTDAPALLDVQVRSFHSDADTYPGVALGGPPGYDSLDIVIEDIQEHLYTKIIYEGQIVGGFLVEDCGDGHFHLATLYIDPDYHNKGVGSQTMQFIEATYPARLWTLDTPVYATRNQHFYEKFGYVKIGEKVFSDDVPLITYQKTMAQPTSGLT